jgi:DNA-binding IclR family transcriptional regulator
MATWDFLTNHAQVLICVAEEPESRLRDIAHNVGITERATHRIITELIEAGYVSREKLNARRNRYGVNLGRPSAAETARRRRDREETRDDS